MADLITEYGYLAILLGCFLEGETVLVLGAIAAKLGFLDIGLVILSGMTGTFVGDSLYFFLGRCYGDRLLRKWPVWRKRAVVVKKLLRKYDTWFIIGFRFVYGMRSICPFVIGMSNVSPRRFMALDLVAGGAWAALVGGASYALGSAVELFIYRLQGFEIYIVALVVGLALGAWVFYLVRIRTDVQDYIQTATDPSTGEHPKTLPPPRRRARQPAGKRSGRARRMNAN